MSHAQYVMRLLYVGLVVLAVLTVLFFLSFSPSLHAAEPEGVCSVLLGHASKNNDLGLVLALNERIETSPLFRLARYSEKKTDLAIFTKAVPVEIKNIGTVGWAVSVTYLRYGGIYLSSAAMFAKESDASWAADQILSDLAKHLPELPKCKP